MHLNCMNACMLHVLVRCPANTRNEKGCLPSLQLFKLMCMCMKIVPINKLCALPFQAAANESRRLLHVAVATMQASDARMSRMLREADAAACEHGTQLEQMLACMQPAAEAD